MPQDSKINVSLGEGENSDSYSEFPGVSGTSNTLPAPDGRSLFNRNGLAKYGALAPVLTGDNVGRIAYSRVTSPPNLTDGHVLLMAVNTSRNNAIVGGILARPRGNVDGDNAVSVVQFAAASYTVDPGEVATATVIRTGAIDRQVTVAYATVNGSAESGTHYTAVSGTLTFAGGETSKTISVTTIDVGAVGNKALSISLSNPTGGAVIGSPNPAAVLIDYDAAVVAPMFLADHATDGSAYMALYNATTNASALKVISATDQLQGNISSSNVFRVSDSKVAITMSDGNDSRVHIYNFDTIVGSSGTVAETSVLTASAAGTLGVNEWLNQAMNSNGILYWADYVSGGACVIRRFDLVNTTVLSSITLTLVPESGYSYNFLVMHGIDASGYLIFGEDQVNGSAHRYKIYRVDATDGTVNGTYLFTPTDFGMGASDTFNMYAATAGSGTNDAIVFQQEGRTNLVRLDTWAAGTASKTTVSTGLDSSDVLLAQLGVFGNVAWAYNAGSLIKLENVLSGSFSRSSLTGSFGLGGGGNALGLPSPPGIARISDTLAVGTYTSSMTNYFITVDLTDGTVATVTGTSVTNTRAVSWSGNRWLETNCQGAM